MTTSLHDYLVDRDVECPNCAYNLRGLKSDRCPECHQRIELGIVLAEPSMGALIAALAALWTLGGSGSAFLVIVLFASWRFRSMPPGELFIVPVLAAGAGIGLTWALGCRRGRMWLRSREAFMKGAVVAGCWTLVAAAAGAFTFILLETI